MGLHGEQNTRDGGILPGPYARKKPLMSMSSLS